MTELKTLNELGFFTEVRNIPNIFKKSKEEAVFKCELKREAIKWCDQREMEEKAKKFLSGVIIDKSNGVIPTADFGIWLFQNFFNITNKELFNLTEEDLK